MGTELKAGGLTEAEHQKKKEMREFRAQIITAAEQLQTSNEHQIDVTTDARIHPAVNNKGAWVQAYVWVDREDVKGEWLDKVENPPIVGECIVVLRALSKLSPSQAPSVNRARDLINRYEAYR